MKRRIVVMLVVVVLSLSLVSHASAAGTRSPQHAAGWLARAIAWIGKTVQPVLTLGSSVTPPGTAGATDVDRGGCLDPHGMTCN